MVPTRPTSVTATLFYNHIIDDIESNFAVVVVVEHIEGHEFLGPAAGPRGGGGVVEFLHHGLVDGVVRVQVPALAVAKVRHVHLRGNDEIETVFRKVDGQRKPTAPGFSLRTFAAL